MLDIVVLLYTLSNLKHFGLQFITSCFCCCFCCFCCCCCCCTLWFVFQNWQILFQTAFSFQASYNRNAKRKKCEQLQFLNKTRVRENALERLSHSTGENANSTQKSQKREIVRRLSPGILERPKQQCRLNA